MKAVAGFVVTLVATLCLVGMLFSGGPAKTVTSCAPVGSDIVPAPISAIPDDVAGWSKAQLEVAAEGLKAAHELGVPRRAATIMIMTGMGESSLENKTFGDAVDITTIGWLQQNEAYGPREDRLNITKAAIAFLTRLLGVEGWQEMEPTLAAHAVQRNQDPFHYREHWEDAEQVVAALTATGGTSCEVTGDEAALARILMEAYAAGNFTDYGEPGLIEKEIGPIAEGQPISDKCKVDPRLLQMLVLTVKKFGSVGISDINRPCIGSTINCPGSRHCDSPATAVDFVAIDGSGLTGSNQASVNLVVYLDSIVPQGSHAGQAGCRSNAGTTVQTGNFTQFDDGCTHQHIDLPMGTDPLTIPAN